MKIEQDKYCTRVYPHVGQDDTLKGFEHAVVVSFSPMSAPSHILISGINQFPCPPDQAVESGLAAIRAALIGELEALAFVELRQGISETQKHDLNWAEYNINEALTEIQHVMQYLSKMRNDLVVSVLSDHEKAYMLQNHPQPRQAEPPPPAQTPEQKMMGKLQQEL